MSPRPDVSEERKDQILDAASKVFVEKGVHESRMDDIGKTSGLSKGALYWYFKSKDEILLAIFDRLLQREFINLSKLSETEGSSREKLLFFTERTIEDVNRILRLMPIAYEFISLAFRQKFIQDAFKQYLNTYINILVPVLKQGVDSGEFRPINPLDVAISIGAVIEGTILLWVYDDTLVSLDEHIRKGIRLIISGIEAR